MKLSKLQITGFGYLNDAVIAKHKSIIHIHLKGHENANEDVWLNCTASTEIANFVKDNLLANLEKGDVILINFCANYEKFSEAFNAADNSNDRIVIFDAKLEAIDAVFINGVYKSFDLKQNVAV